MKGGDNISNSLDRAIEWMDAMEYDANQMLAMHGDSMNESDRCWLKEKETLAEVCLKALKYMKEHNKEE
jgi:hypothetical protein